MLTFEASKRLVVVNGWFCLIGRRGKIRQIARVGASSALPQPLVHTCKEIGRNPVPDYSQHPLKGIAFS